MNNGLPMFQKNEVYKILVDNGLDPNEFTWDFNDEGVNDFKPLFDSPTPMLVHVKTGYYFRFGMLRNAHRSEYSPGRDRIIVSHYPGSWPGQLSDVKTWADTLKKEFGESDLWNQFGLWFSSQQINDETFQEDNDTFSNEILMEITARLKRLEQQIYEIRNYNVAEETYIREKFEELTSSARNQSKISWMQTLLGIIFSISGQLNFSLLQTHLNLNSAMQMFQPYLPSFLKQLAR